jgi:hypothetical protein
MMAETHPKIQGVEMAGQPVQALRVVFPSGDISVLPWSLFLKAHLLANDQGTVVVIAFASSTVRISGDLRALQILIEGTASQWLRTIQVAAPSISSIEIEDPD